MKQESARDLITSRTDITSFSSKGGEKNRLARVKIATFPRKVASQSALLLPLLASP